MAHDAATEAAGKLVIRNIGLMLSGALERPILDANALAAQGTNFDGVSGATVTSNGYKQSLQSAIDAAGAAGVTTLV